VIQEVTDPKVPAVSDAKKLKLQQLRQLAKEFEAVFLHMMQKSMRATVKKSGFFGGGQAEETFTNLFDLQVAERGAGGLGIGKMILKKYAKHVREDAPKVDVRG
jgi:flagellar protein FlgJ